MKKNTRRGLLKGLMVTAPAVWTKPVVNSIVLPSHAQSSCGAPLDCYIFGQPGSFSWPGGVGPHFVRRQANNTCAEGQEPGLPWTLVVASSDFEAAGLLGCGFGQIPQIVETTPALDEPCAFYRCVVTG